MTAPQGAPGSGGTAADPTPARPQRWLLVENDGRTIDTDEDHFLMDWVRLSRRSCRIVKLGDLDSLPTLELPHRGQQ